MEGLRLKKVDAQGQVRFLFNITANYRIVFKAILKKFKAILRHFKVILKQIKVILKQIKAVNRYKSLLKKDSGQAGMTEKRGRNDKGGAFYVLPHQGNLRGARRYEGEEIFRV
jgi:hypothetical protein